MDLVPVQALNLGIAEAAVDTAAILDGVMVHLYQNDITPTPNRPIGDYTEATYTGYAAEALTWLAPTLNDAGQIEVIGTVGEFRPTASTVQNTIYGLYLTDTAGAVLLEAARFDNAPLPMNSVLDSIITTFRQIMPAGGTVAVVS